jgi:signal recognition particle GTPase
MPISVVGVGEGVEDVAAFDPEAFARGLFERP